MTDKSKMSMLENLELMKGKDGERRPYSARAQAEIDEANATQARIDAMDEGGPEDATSEDEASEPETGCEPHGLINCTLCSDAELLASARALAERYRKANIDLNAKLIRLSQTLAKIKADHPEYFDGT